MSQIIDALPAGSVLSGYELQSVIGYTPNSVNYEATHTLLGTGALVDIVSAGGDTDTNAAIAGALLGAWKGLNHIPRTWLAAVHKANPACYTALLPAVEALPAYPRVFCTGKRKPYAGRRLSGVAPVAGLLNEDERY